MKTCKACCGSGRFSSTGRSAFNLLELIVTIGIIAILATLASLGWSRLRPASVQITSLNDMRSIGVAMRLYAADHEDNLPARLKTGEKWPHVLMPYLQNPIVFADKSDTNNFIVRQTDPLRHDFNNTSYIMNGFNDVSGNTPDALEVRVNRIDSPAQVILLGTPKSGSGQFYMDMLEGPHGNHIDILDLQRYGNGSNYLFVDGSAKFLSKQEYNHRMWLVNKDFTVPQ